MGNPGFPRITGFGGFFFRADDTDGLADWYRDMFGIDRVPSDYGTEPWCQQAGPTVFAPFSADTEYFGDDKSKRFMLNFRVDDLEAMVAHLQTQGVEVKVDPETYPNGRFARVYDPEGNPIELWEPQDNPG